MSNFQLNFDVDSYRSDVPKFLALEKFGSWFSLIYLNSLRYEDVLDFLNRNKEFELFSCEESFNKRDSDEPNEIFEWRGNSADILSLKARQSGEFIYLNTVNKSLIRIKTKDSFIKGKYLNNKKAKAGTTCDVEFYYNRNDNNLNWINELKGFGLGGVEKNTRGRISFLASDGGFYLKEIKMRPPGEINLELNYGSDFLPFYKKVMDCLNSRDRSSSSGSLIGISGVVGGGKTTFLRHVIFNSDRRVIFIPPVLFPELTSPSLISFLISDCTDHTLLVIEDCESLVLKREDNPNANSVSSLLNFSSGLVSDLGDMITIVSWNTKLENVDEAVTRRGRMLAYREFSKLSIENSNKLIKHLGKNFIATEPMSLSDIYGIDDDNFVNKEEDNKSKIGFNT